MAALNALPVGGAITFTRLQSLLGITAGNLVTHLRKLDGVGYTATSQTGRGRGSQASAARTDEGRHALNGYRRALREILGQD